MATSLYKRKTLSDLKITNLLFFSESFLHYHVRFECDRDCKVIAIQMRAL